MITNSFLFVLIGLLILVSVLLLFVLFGLFSLGSKLSDVVSLLITIQKDTKKIQGCEEKLEIIMINGMSKEK